MLGSRARTTRENYVVPTGNAERKPGTLARQSMAKTKKHYDELAEVEKFSEEDADYRDGEGSLHSHGTRHHCCRKCIHYLVRKVDDFGVCEIVRPLDDQPIDEDYVCSFWTRDGERFPLLK
jgi:hypothetical protein